MGTGRILAVRGPGACSWPHALSLVFPPVSSLVALVLSKGPAVGFTWRVFLLRASFVWRTRAGGGGTRAGGPRFRGSGWRRGCSRSYCCRGRSGGYRRRRCCHGHGRRRGRRGRPSGEARGKVRTHRPCNRGGGGGEAGQAQGEVWPSRAGAFLDALSMTLFFFERCQTYSDLVRNLAGYARASQRNKRGVHQSTAVAWRIWKFGAYFFSIRQAWA